MVLPHTCSGTASLYGPDSGNPPSLTNHVRSSQFGGGIPNALNAHTALHCSSQWDIKTLTGRVMTVMRVSGLRRFSFPACLSSWMPQSGLGPPSHWLSHPLPGSSCLECSDSHPRARLVSAWARTGSQESGCYSLWPGLPGPSTHHS